GCPNDPNKIVPGQCGCGFSDAGSDSEGDGTPDCSDACPNDPNKIAPGICGCGVPENGCSPRSILAWRSLRTHTGGNQLPIVLNPTATGNGASGPTVETRGPSATNAGVRKVQVDFSGPVTLGNVANITVTYRV